MKQWIGHTLKEKILRRTAKSAKGQRDVIILDVSLFYVSLEAHNFPVKKIPSSCPNAHVWSETQGEHSEKLRKIPTALSALRTGNAYSFPTAV